MVNSSANLEEFFSHLAGPVNFWIGNTSPRTDEDIVKRVLKKCADNLNIENFEVMEVEPLSKDDNPRTRTWRVQVPHQFKEIMAKDEMCPPGWSHRTFW